MQIKKVAKKIAAISTGALMLGATLTGALAQSYSLADLPSPFVANGVLDNTVIVVGKTAETADVLGAVDVAAALQAAAVSSQMIETSEAVAPTVSDGVKIEKAGNKYNFGDDMDTVLESTSLDESDLPDLLQDEEFDDSAGETSNTEDYEQTLTFTAGQGVLNVFQDDDLAPEGGVYLHLDKASMYTYTIEFDSSINFDTTAVGGDFEGEQLVLQGNVYTITDASASSGILDELTLVGGDSVVWLTQDQPYTIGGHTVTVVDVSNSEDKCGINVDGQTVWVDDGATEDFGDLSIGVLEVVAVYTEKYDADTCELSLGSNELVLKDGDSVEANGVNLDGSEVTFSGSSGAWDGFTLTYTIGDEDDGVNSDEVFLDEGGAWSDPVFGNWKVLYEGVTAKTEEMTLSRSGSDNAEFVFMNNAGDEITVPYVYDGSALPMLGEDPDEAVLLLPGEDYIGEAATPGDPEGTLLLYTTTNGEVRVLEVDKVYGTTGANANKTTIKDWNTGDTLADKEDFTPSTYTLISLGSLGSVNLSLVSGSSGTVNYSAGGSYGAGTPESKYEATLTFTDSNVTLLETNDDERPVSTLVFALSYDGVTDQELDVLNPSEIGAGSITAVDESDSNSDDQVGVTERGTMLYWDTDNKDKVTIVYPEEEAYANVFVTPFTATAVGGGAGGVTADKVNPFSVGLAVLDEDAASMSKHMVVVGGPCVNTVAASLMGNPASCAEGFEEGKAMLKYFNRNGRAALLVAGYSAQDTLGASYVLADYEDYALSGNEVEVVVASLSDISVSTV
jgi:hypothetical protein